ncbi:hypothetical protein HU200_054055 [Digitaria exilis]|uniref:Uncharacterized protein n=1 Tax=Digitaria exilis TaxID=1010633 RepID=A0A835E829_9POAL|nr:hypothetical protein HU200_054055 [Digitaria exilis]
MDAQGGLDPLLGRLTSILIDEAQLLGRVRGDVEFIKDEMECMNSLILQLTEAQHRDHIQVVDLTRDSEGNVEHYIHYVGGGSDGDGLLAYLHRILRFLRTMPARHRIAMRIRELKVRARDVGDRRQRYGVTVPPASAMAGTDMYEDEDVEPAGGDTEQADFHRQRRAVLLDDAEPPKDKEEAVKEYINTILKCLPRPREQLAAASTAAARGDHLETQHVRVFAITGTLQDQVVNGVYQHPSLVTLLRCKVYVSYKEKARTTLAKTLEQISAGVQPHQEDELKSKEREHSMGTSSVDKDELDRLVCKLQGHLKGKRFLMVFEDVSNDWEWECLLDALLRSAVGCHPNSAIIMTTRYDRLAMESSPYKIIKAYGPDYDYIIKARKMVGDNSELCVNIADQLYLFSAFVTKMFLHLLYAKPIMTEDEGQKIMMEISKCVHLNKGIAQKVVMWCYNELPSKYRSCLLYLATFPQGHVIRTTALARRWAAEGLITTATRSHKRAKAADQAAEHYWDELLTRGFITPVEISAEANIKSCTLHHEVHKFIAKISRDVNILETNLPTEWSHRLSIHNRIGRLKTHSEDQRKGIVSSLPSLATSPQWKLLKVLDLEGCHGLEKRHLKSICKILLLKYLSLRNTDVTELPKKIKELQGLETLDIRQTMTASNDAGTSEESIATVNMPLCIERMKNLEILSHVQVTKTGSELVGITELLKLRKLGVVLQGNNAKLSDLFSQIEKLEECLRSLSIRMDQTAVPENHDATSLPQFIERLNISGIAAGRLPLLVQEHHQLSKMTLSQTYLKKDDISIIGKLHGLRWLRLQNKSYTERELAFRADEFQSLNFVLVEVSEVSNISFAHGTAPKLERIVWSFATMEALSGINHLHKLKMLELNGDCNLDLIEEELVDHPSNPRVNMDMDDMDLHYF